MIRNLMSAFAFIRVVSIFFFTFIFFPKDLGGEGENVYSLLFFMLLWFLFLGFKNFLYVLVFCLHGPRGRCWIPWNWSHSWLWAAVWVLETKPRSTAWASSALTCCTISPPPLVYFFVFFEDFIAVYCLGVISITPSPPPALSVFPHSLSIFCPLSYCHVYVHMFINVHICNTLSSLSGAPIYMCLGLMIWD